MRRREHDAQLPRATSGWPLEAPTCGALFIHKALCSTRYNTYYDTYTQDFHAII